ncbi:MAG: SIS domain-containing protein [Erysipelotrichaceae bacterium]|nr:SIS domain-containing protein [Erysipelotrichaceae bacterium]
MYKYAYMNKVQELMDKIYETQQEVIDDLAIRFAENIKNNRIIHVFGTGHSHMIGIELFCRAGGLGNVNALLDQDVLTSNGARRSGAMEKVSGISDILYDQYNIKAGDIMIITSNSGRNAMPIEMALRAKKEGVYTIAMTNLKQSEKTSSRHASGKRLFECVDCVIDSCVPEGDSMMTVGNVKTAPGSTVSGVIVLNTIVNEALQILAKENVELPVFQSQNVDGFNNDAIYAKYADRVKHF